MSEVIAVDVIVPNPAPSVDVFSVGVQGPPGEAGAPGPAGPAGPQGPAGAGAGPHAASHYVGGADALAGSLAASDVRVGANPAQSGAIRLANNQEITGRNATNDGDWRVAKINADNALIAGDLNNVTYVDGAPVNIRSSGSSTFRFDGTGVYPVSDNERVCGYPTLRWSQGHFGTSVNVGTNPAQSGAIRLANNQAITVRNAGNTADVTVATVAANGFLYLGNGAGGIIPQTTFYFTTPMYLENVLNISERAAPGAAPGVNSLNLWAEDNGAGKTRLMVRFATGAAVQIAIEP